MRTKNEKDGSKAKGPGIVDRQLAQVFTNGTIVDGTYLTTDEANHCVSIKVGRSRSSDNSPLSRTAACQCYPS